MTTHHLVNMVKAGIAGVSCAAIKMHSLALRGDQNTVQCSLLLRACAAFCRLLLVIQSSTIFNVRLSSIKLSGFKSFVDPTHFQVPGQLVGVVGPNGCGKSNIIDAVRWVLGESRASELRGESMQDVIFNGTTSRRPSGRASVELVFDNHEGRAAGQWGQYAEIAVRRTLARDGTSIYYINNQVVRRRDIQDIFLGTGLGPRAYAIIGQGMIAKIIEARPEELRVFLEEAAGVSKYKERRRETENRLHAARDNLVRVEDILRELNQNLEKLHGQAEVAREFFNLQARQEQTQQLLWLLRRNEARQEQEKFFRDIDNIQTALEADTARLRSLETALEQSRQAHYAAGDTVHHAQGQLYQINAEIGSLEAQIRFVQESRLRLQTQLQGLDSQLAEWQHQQVQHQSDLMEAMLMLEEQTIQTEEAQYQLEYQQARLPEQEDAWRQAQQQLATLQASVSAVQQKMALALAHQENAAHILNGLARRRERLQQEREALEAALPRQEEDLGLQVQEKQAALDTVQQQRESLQQQQAVQHQACHSLQQQWSDEHSVQTQLRARLQALVQLQDNVQRQGKAQSWLSQHGLIGLPRLWQRLDIEPGWEAALEAILRERTGAIVLEDATHLPRLLTDPPPAKLALTTMPLSQDRHAVPFPACPLGNLPAFIDLIRVKETALQPLLEDWLHDVVFAPDLETALAQRSHLPPGTRLVTPEAHVFSRSGVHCFAADSEQEGMLKRQQEIDKLEHQTRAQQRLTDAARSDLDLANATQSQLAAQLQTQDQAVTHLTKELHQLHIAHTRQEELQQRQVQHSLRISEELAELQQQQEEQSYLQAQAHEESESHEHMLSTQQDAYQQQRSELLSKEQQLDQARQSVREKERRAHDAEYAQTTGRARISELERSLATAAHQVDQLQATQSRLQQELAGLQDETSQEGLQQHLAQRVAQEQALTQAREEMERLGQCLRQQEEGRMLCERGLQPQRDQVVALQLKEQAARLSQEQYAQHLREAGADEASLSSSLRADMRPSGLQAEVTRLTGAITALGAVNLGALEELSQASVRKDFLDAQHADLAEAIATLEDAIAKIDRETRDLLQETFDQVNSHFGELFPVLFGGGTARLIMTGDEILNAGVQVMAQPPGKKNATIHLLSGGEKALTATALVFSMFQLNPAPFCLLDEVDAPLDDANTERFCNMVQRMSANTQFLFISHNRIAMAMAEQLIGVTMQEQGVSRIVTVDMQTAKELAETPD